MRGTSGYSNSSHTTPSARQTRLRRSSVFSGLHVHQQILQTVGIVDRLAPRDGAISADLRTIHSPLEILIWVICREKMLRLEIFLLLPRSQNFTMHTLVVHFHG